mgnify:CR=1 FL=1
MALQKPRVMLYFEMRNVFEELSNEKRNPGQRDSRLLRLPFPLTNGLHPFLTAPKQKHQMIPIGIQLQPQQQQQPQPQQQPQQIVVICPRRASRPGNHSDRFLPRYFPNPPGSTPPGNRLAHANCRDGKAGSIRPTALCRCLAGGFYPPLQGVVRLLWQSRRQNFPHPQAQNSWYFPPRSAYTDSHEQMQRLTHKEAARYAVSKAENISGVRQSDFPPAQGDSAEPLPAPAGI